MPVNLPVHILIFEKIIKVIDKKIVKAGNRFLLMETVESFELLPVGSYALKFDAETGMVWLEEQKPFKKPEKVYDIDGELRRLIQVKFNATKKNLGVLLTGAKGQGKTFTAKMLCVELGLPVVSITGRIPREVDFLSYLANIPQEFVLFIDEFEKIFIKEDKDSAFHTQEAFLSFMDGRALAGRVLFLLTSNNEVSTYLLNRPSRISFLKEYDELSEEIFDMIVEDLLEDKSYVEDLKDNTSLINLNVDLLMSIIKDINLFKIPYSSFMNMYNYRMEMYRYEIFETKNGAERFVNITRTERKFKVTDRHFGGYAVNDIIKMGNGEVRFKSSTYEEDEEGNSVSRPVEIRAALLRSYESVKTLTI